MDWLWLESTGSHEKVSLSFSHIVLCHVQCRHCSSRRAPTCPGKDPVCLVSLCCAGEWDNYSRVPAVYGSGLGRRTAKQDRSTTTKINTSHVGAAAVISSPVRSTSCIVCLPLGCIRSSQKAPLCHLSCNDP